MIGSGTGTGSGSGAIAIDRLTKHYGPIVGVEDLSLDVQPGEVFGFLGANGAGKTTTIRCLLDLVRPSSGGARILGHDCHRQSLAARAQVGYLPSDMPLYPEMTGAAYLDYLARVGSQPVARGLLERLLQRFDISTVDLGRRLRNQSHGMKRKIGVIQALMTGARVIILDEPTLGLDPLMIEAFCQTVHELRRDGRTVFLSSHVLSEVEKMCDRVGLIRRGHLVEVRTLRELRQRATRQVVIEFTRPVDVLLPALPGVTVVTREPSRWILDVNGPIGPLTSHLAGLPVADLIVETFKFEDYFLDRYAGDAS